jgi:ABC-2 type transport system permease protein
MPWQPVHVVRHSAANAFADLKAVYTWKTWIFGWLGRMLAQVTFFVIVGQLLGRPDQVPFLVIGNSVMTSVIESMMVVASSTWERSLGTLPLLSAAPARLVWVFFGRSVQWPVSGSGTSLVALFVLGPLFGVHWTLAEAPAVVVLVLLAAFGTYCFGLFLAGLVLNIPGFRNIVSNGAYLIMMAICGVQVPLDFWPGWVRAVAQCLPLTHALAGVRLVASGGGAAEVVAQAALTVAIAAVWFGFAYVVFLVQEIRGRHAGTIHFA